MVILLDRIIKHEGFKPKSYKDSKGIWTIGYGHNMEADPEFDPVCGYEGVLISEVVAYRYLTIDIMKVIDSCWMEKSRIRPALQVSDIRRRRVFYEMAFQLGINGLYKFKNTLKHAAEKDFSKSSKEMLNSKWYREDTPKRALFLSREMDQGTETVIA